MKNRTRTAIEMIRIIGVKVDDGEIDDDFARMAIESALETIQEEIGWSKMKQIKEIADVNIELDKLMAAT